MCYRLPSSHKKRLACSLCSMPSADSCSWSDQGLVRCVKLNSINWLMLASSPTMSCHGIIRAVIIPWGMHFTSWVILCATSLQRDAMSCRATIVVEIAIRTLKSHSCCGFVSRCDVCFGPSAFWSVLMAAVLVLVSGCASCAFGGLVDRWRMTPCII